MKKTTPCPSTVVVPKDSSESAAECFISTALTPLLYELSVANAPLPAADCRDIADKIGARIGGVINRVQTVLAQLETIDTTALAAKGLYEEANAISRARVFIDRLIGFQDTASASALSQDAPDNSPASLPESSSIESSAAPAVDQLPCPDCAKAARHAYSDATTAGFFYDKCEKHRVSSVD